MKKKLMSRGGFSLAELLMVVLILGLIVAIIGGGITVVQSSYQRVTLRANGQTLMSTVITKVTDEFRFASDIETEGTSTTFISGNNGIRVSFENDETKGIVLKSTVTEDAAPIVTEKTMTDGLVPAITYSYEDGLFTANITITRDGEQYLNQEITVRPLN